MLQGIKILLGCKADRVKPVRDEGCFTSHEAVRINTNVSKKLKDKDPSIDEFNFHSLTRRNIFNLR